MSWEPFSEEETIPRNTSLQIITLFVSGTELHTVYMQKPGTGKGSKTTFGLDHTDVSYHIQYFKK